MPTQFVLGHISDLHFSEGTDRSNPNHAHSVELLVALERRLSGLGELDCLVVSGDVSNQGDRQSLITANGYLFSTIPIGRGEVTGLKLPNDRVRVIPGNHDAWNAPGTGKLIDRRQRSLEHYNYAFPGHQITEKGCYYDWISKDGSSLYLAFVDSCFLGDTEPNNESAFGTIRYDEAVAKGKLSVTQTENLLEWHDQGMRGVLPDVRNPGRYIDAALFTNSLKVLIMHHYLFEPPEHKSDYFMRMKHRDVVFRNVALSDFDVLLCGHKHVASFDVHPYGEYFDNRAVNRYMMNYFRRLIGLDSLPIQFVDDNGRKMPKALTWLAETIGSWFKAKKPGINADDVADQVFNLLKGGLEDPEGLEKKVREYLHANGASGASMLETRELKAIRKRISSGLDIEQRRHLRKIADGVATITKDLQRRPFLQIMSGSSAKNFSSADKKRSFNLYRINPKEDSWEFICERYIWGDQSFSQQPFISAHTFRRCT